MNTAEFIKQKLHIKTIETSTVPQENGSSIVMERCEVEGKYKIVLVYDDKDKAVVIC